MLEREIRALEERLLNPKVRGSRDELGKLLADDFLEFGKSGRTFDREAIIAELESESPFGCALENFSVKRLAEDVVLATYTASAARSGTTTRSLRSSVWVYRQDRWQLTFHQGTLKRL